MKPNRRLAFILAILIVFVFVFRVDEKEAEALTGFAAVMLGYLALGAANLGFNMIQDPNYARQFSDAIGNSGQNIRDSVASWDIDPMYFQNMPIYEDEQGNQYAEMTGNQLAQAYSDIAAQFPETIDVEREYTYMSDYTGRYPYVYNYESNNRYYAQTVGYWYKYDIKVNPSNDRSMQGMIDATLWVYCHTLTGNTSFSTYYLKPFICLRDSEYSNNFRNAIIDGVDIVANPVTGSGWLARSNINSIAWPSIYDATKAFYSVLDKGQIKIVYGNRDNENIMGYVLSSDLGYENLVYTGDMTLVKTYYEDLASRLNALMINNAELAQTVIGVPVDTEGEGDDLPGLIAALRGLAANQGADTQSLIDALAQAATGAAAATQAVAQTQEQIGELTNELTDIKEQVAEITEAVTTEVDIPIDNLSLPQIIATKFPFCIPFDLFNAFNSFSGLPREAPSWTIPLEVQNTRTEIEIDLSEYETWAVVTRWGTLIAFNIGLILITRRLIKG